MAKTLNHGDNERENTNAHMNWPRDMFSV